MATIARLTAAPGQFLAACVTRALLTISTMKAIVVPCQSGPGPRGSYSTSIASAVMAVKAEDGYISKHGFYPVVMNPWNRGDCDQWIQIKTRTCWSTCLWRPGQ